MKFLEIAASVSLLFAAGAVMADDDLQESVTFQMCFEDNADVDRANGNDQLQQNPSEDVQDGYSYVEGVKGKALYNTNPRGAVRRYEMQDNINFDAPGSVTFWIKPVAWQKLTQDSPQQPNGRYKTITTCLFMTGWSKTGYVVLERACPEFLGRPEKLRLLFPLFSGVTKGYYEKEFAWKDNQWYFIALTWGGYDYTAYINGEAMISASHTEKLKQSDMHKNFEVRPSVGVALDEFTVYDKQLSAEELKAMYEKDAPQQ